MQSYCLRHNGNIGLLIMPARSAEQAMTLFIFHDESHRVNRITARRKLNLIDLLLGNDDCSGLWVFRRKNQAGISCEMTLSTLGCAIELGRLSLVLDIHARRKHERVGQDSLFKAP